MLFMFALGSMPVNARIISDDVKIPSEVEQEEDNGVLNLQSYNCNTNDTTYFTHSVDLTEFEGILTTPTYFSEEIRASLAENENSRDGSWQTANVQNLPYSAVMYLSIWIDANDDGIPQLSEYAQGTGYLVGPNVLLTAAHNTYQIGTGVVDQVRAYLQYENGGSSTPYYAGTFIWSTAYTQYGNENYDWCIMIMQDDLGGEVGWYYGLGTYGDYNPVGDDITISGYSSSVFGAYQHYCDGEITDKTTYKIKYDIDTKSGQSGSPVYNAYQTNWIAWGIHTKSASLFTDASGVRFTYTLYDIICDKIDEGKELYGY